MGTPVKSADNKPAAELPIIKKLYLTIPIGSYGNVLRADGSGQTFSFSVEQTAIIATENKLSGGRTLVIPRDMAIVEIA